MKLAHLITAIALTMGSTAYAMQCPLDMKKIDAALAENQSLSSAQMARVKSLRAEGEALHKSGKHGQSVEKLGEAKRILGIE